jgi:hypothetical protein
MAHTSGPWEAEPEAGKGAWICNANGEWTALALGDTQETAIANKHLITAAPELLACCRRAAEILLKNRDQNPTEAQVFAALKWAIAKATGALTEQHDPVWCTTQREQNR